MTTQSNHLARKPTHRLYRVSGDGKDAIWTPVGAAWPNKDGQGFSVTCEAVPLQGRIIMRVTTERARGGQQDRQRLVSTWAAWCRPALPTRLGC